MEKLTNFLSGFIGGFLFFFLIVSFIILTINGIFNIGSGYDVFYYTEKGLKAFIFGNCCFSGFLGFFIGLGMMNEELNND